MIRSFLRWACYYREVRLPFTQWAAWLDPTAHIEGSGGVWIEIDRNDGMIQLGHRWAIRLQNYGPEWAGHSAAVGAPQAQ